MRSWRGTIIGRAEIVPGVCFYMKKCDENTNRIMYAENGMLIVEATIVFPVMVLVIFLMLFAGNAYFQKCRVDAIVTELALEAAARCGDPYLEKVEAHTSVGDMYGQSIYPYRYLLSGEMRQVQADMQSTAADRINKLGTGLFSGMNPAKPKIKAEVHNYFLYTTISLEADYSIKMPIRMLFAKDNIRMNYSAQADFPVADSAEFIRNVDMVEDFLERTGVQKSIDDAKNKLKQAVEKVNGWFKG